MNHITAGALRIECVELSRTELYGDWMVFGLWIVARARGVRDRISRQLAVPVIGGSDPAGAAVTYSRRKNTFERNSPST
jgi:hypothetical protein